VCKGSRDGLNWLLHGSELHCLFVQQLYAGLHPIYQSDSYDDQGIDKDE